MWEPLLIIIIICYIYIALFWVLKALYIQGGGGSPRPPPMCSIHLYDATAAIVCQNANHTPAYWWRGDRVMKPISIWGWLGAQWGNLSRMPGLHPYSFSKGYTGIFNDHRESSPWFNVSSERRMTAVNSCQVHFILQNKAIHYLFWKPF